MQNILMRLVLCLVAAQLCACGGGDSNSSSPQIGTNSRGYRLAATGIQAVPGGMPFFQLAPGTNTLAAISNDVDMLTVFVEHYGIPWDEFAAADAPPDTHPWTQIMRSFANAAAATGKPIMLQTVLSRDKLAARAGANGSMLTLDDNWKAACFNFANTTDGATYRTAYRRYAVWMAGLFRPQHYVHAVEISAYRSSCGAGAGWDALIATANDAYQAVKAAQPSVLVYPSFIAMDLYSNTAQGYNSTLVDALRPLSRDRYGLSLYPQGSVTDPTLLPSDLLSRVRDRNPTEARLVVTETGWNSQTLRVGTPATCVDALASSETQVRAYLDWLLNRAQTDRVEVVNWWSARDLLPEFVMGMCYVTATPPTYAACASDPWCGAVNIFRGIQPAQPNTGEVLFKAFGTMGLRNYDGAAKSMLMDRWQTARALPIAP